MHAGRINAGRGVVGDQTGFSCVVKEGLYRGHFARNRCLGIPFVPQKQYEAGHRALVEQAAIDHSGRTEQAGLA